MVVRSILPIHVGGTIASAASRTGFRPERSFEDLFRQVNQNLVGDRRIAVAETPFGDFGIDSAGMDFSHMAKIGATIKDNYSDHDAFIVTHGTDTLAYTASMLAFMLQGIQKPVIVTGAQKTLEDPGSDVADNLGTALLAASTSNCGVWVAFHGKLINGVRATKIDIGVECVDAFVSNAKDEISLTDFQATEYFINRGQTETFNVTVSDAVDVFSLTHTTDPAKLKKYLYNSDLKVLIILIYGMSGHRSELIDILAAWSSDCKTTVIAKTHSPYGSTDLSKYELGVSALKRGILSSLDMTLESVYCKSINIIARNNNSQEFAKLFYDNICGELDAEVVQKYKQQEKNWLSNN